MKRTAWNSTLPERTKPMARMPLRPGSGVARHTPMKRSGKLKVRKVSQRFRERRTPGYPAFIRGHRCLIGAGCVGPVECAHLRSRGAGGFDLGNCLPLCEWHHEEQHNIGVKSWRKKYGLTVDSENATAELYAAEWRATQREEQV